MTTDRDDAHFLRPAPDTPQREALYRDDVDELGHVMNASRLWAYQPAAKEALFALMQTVTDAGGLTFRQRGLLVSAAAAALGDSYCAFAWGNRLAGVAGPGIAAAVLRGDDDGGDGLPAAERAMVRWARRVVRDPSATTPADVDALRAVGFDDATIFALTVYVALRVTFSTVNAALGAGPDAEFGASTPAPVREAIAFGRPLPTS